MLKEGGGDGLRRSQWFCVLGLGFSHLDICLCIVLYFFSSMCLLGHIHLLPHMAGVQQRPPWLPHGMKPMRGEQLKIKSEFNTKYDSESIQIKNKYTKSTSLYKNILRYSRWCAFYTEKKQGMAHFSFEV